MSSIRLWAWLSIGTAAIAVAQPLRGQEPNAEPAALQSLFEQSLRDGVMSPSGLDLRRQPGAVAFLQGVLDGERTVPERAHALQHLMRVGAVAEPAVPSILLALDGGGNVAHLAAVTLGEIGPFLQSDATRTEIQDRLVKRGQRERGNQTLHNVVARSWSRVEAVVTRDVEVLIAEMTSGNPFRTELALQRLIDAGPAAQAAVPVAVQMVSQGRVFMLDREAIARLAALGFRPRPEWTAEVRESLFGFFTYVAPHEPGALPLFLERLRKAKDADKVNLVQRIGQIGQGQRIAVAALLPLVRDKAPLVAREAVTSLGMLGPTAASARTELESLLSSPDAQLAARARAALRQIEPAPGK